ncbi:MAG: hypothetical protein R6V46_17200 [Desulfatiglandaceae bacterium]
MKEIIRAFVDVIRVRVKILVNIFMTVPAGILTMNRGMEFRGADEPR